MLPALIRITLRPLRKRGARCVNVAPVARNVSRHGAMNPQRSQRLFITTPAVYRQ